MGSVCSANTSCFTIHNFASATNPSRKKIKLLGCPRYDVNHNNADIDDRGDIKNDNNTCDNTVLHRNTKVVVDVE